MIYSLYHKNGDSTEVSKPAAPPVFTGYKLPPSKPVFSLVHSTARANGGWRKAADAWLQSANKPSQVEYILCADAGTVVSGLVSPVQLVWNYGRKCAVDGWNTAAAASTGQFLITVADDWFPCTGWDTELLNVIPDLNGEYVVELSTGGNDGLLTFSLLTRKYYNRYGYIFYPEYVGMYADNDFTDVARRDGVVIDARHLPVFQHFHPEYGTAKWDETYLHQHRTEAFDIGRDVYERRKRNGFIDKVVVIKKKQKG